MNWQFAATIAGPLIGAIALIVAAVIDRRSKRRTAEATVKASEAAQTTAEAAIHDAFTRAYEAASNNWARENEAIQKWCESQADELHRLSERQANTDVALEAEKLARRRAEGLYAVALVYLRRIADWVTYHWPGETLPPPPPDLAADLEGYFNNSTGD